MLERRLVVVSIVLNASPANNNIVDMDKLLPIARPTLESHMVFADYNRTNGRFVVQIPDGLPSEIAAPMLCGGITTLSPLKRNKCGPGKRIGIIGSGILGHFGILFAKVRDASRVVGISRTSLKKEEAFALGADHYIATYEDTAWPMNNAQTLLLIVRTNSSYGMPFEGDLTLLKV